MKLRTFASAAATTAEEPSRSPSHHHVATVGGGDDVLSSSHVFRDGSSVAMHLAHRLVTRHVICVYRDGRRILDHRPPLVVHDGH